MARNRFFDKIVLIFSVYFLTCNDKSETNSSFVIAELDTAITTIGEPVKYSFLIQKPENKIIKTNKLVLKNSYEIDSLGFENNDNFIKKPFKLLFGILVNLFYQVWKLKSCLMIAFLNTAFL